MRNLVVFIFCISSIHTFAQVHQWTSIFNNYDTDDYAVVAEFDNEGNVILTGHFEGRLDADPGPLVQDIESPDASLQFKRDPFTIKLDQNGDHIWHHHFGSGLDEWAYAMTTDNSGNVFIAGRYTYSFSTPVLNAVDTVFYPNGYGFIAKYNSDGQLLWIEELGIRDVSMRLMSDGADGFYFYSSITETFDIDPGDGVLLVGDENSNYTIVCHYTADGDLDWHFTMPTLLPCNHGSICFTKPGDIDRGSAGEIIVSGFLRGTADFDPGIGEFLLTSEDANLDPVDRFVAAYTDSGQFLWAKLIPGSIFDSTAPMAVDQNGYVYIHDGRDKIYQLDPINHQPTVHLEFPDFWIHRLVMDCSSFGLVMAVGTQYPFDADPSSGVLMNIPDNSNNNDQTPTDLFIVSYDVAGNLLFNLPLQSAGSEYIRDIYINEQDELLISGQLSSYIDFDPSDGEAIYAGSNDIFVAKYSLCAAESNPFSLNGPTDICLNEPIQYNIQDNTPGTDLLWTFPQDWNVINSNNMSLNITPGLESGAVSAYTYDQCGFSHSGTVSVEIDTVVFVVTDRPYVEVCPGEPVLYSIATNSENVNWDGLITDVTFYPQMSETYNIQATSPAGCEVLDTTIVLDVYDLLATPAVLDQYAFVGDDVVFSMEPAFDDAFISWKWNFNGTFSGLPNGNQNILGIHTTNLTLLNVPITYDDVQFYAVISDNGCSDTTDIATLHISVVGVNEQDSLNSINVFPMPASSFMHISSTLPFSGAFCALYDSYGRLVQNVTLHGFENKVELHGLSQGIYWISIPESGYQKSILIE
jgi:hypothetical protein